MSPPTYMCRDILVIWIPPVGFLFRPGEWITVTVYWIDDLRPQIPQMICEVFRLLLDGDAGECAAFGGYVRAALRQQRGICAGTASPEACGLNRSNCCLNTRKLVSITETWRGKHRKAGGIYSWKPAGPYRTVEVHPIIGVWVLTGKCSTTLQILFPDFRSN